MNKSPLLILTLLNCLLFSAQASSSPVGENAGEISVDRLETTPPTLNPAHPDAAVDKSGRSIFVWDGNPAVNGGKDIFLRIYDVGGSPEGDAVVVNTYLTDSQHYPRVAVSGDGSFLVIWQSEEVPEGSANERKVVRSQAFDANANPVESELLVSELPPRGTTEIHADVAALRDGGYIVVWQSAETHGDDTNTSIQARRIGADGLPLAGQFQVNTITGNAQTHSSVTELADGGFLVVWEEPQVQGQRFDVEGVFDGNQFQINTLTVGNESETDAVMHDDGRVLVIWKDDEEAGDSWEIRGRLFTPNLAAQGVDFRINTLITGGQLNPKAAAYAQGGFFVVWESGVSAGDDNAPNSIEGRIVTGYNQFAGSQFLVNSWTEDSQQFPGIGGKNGRIAVAWDSQSNPENADSAIRGQFWYICGIFCDSFE